MTIKEFVSGQSFYQYNNGRYCCVKTFNVDGTMCYGPKWAVDGDYVVFDGHVLKLVSGVLCGTCGSAELVYHNVYNLIDLLQPKEVNSKKLKLGNKFGDGGYVINERLLEVSDVLYSYGISNDYSFDSDWVKNTNKMAYMFDHTVDINTGDKSLIFVKKGVSAFTTADTDSIENHIKLFCNTNKKILLKIDVEGCEYEVFEHMSSDILNIITGIAVEFHIFNETTQLKLYEVLNKLSKKFVLIHIHGNNCAGTFSVYDKNIPRLLELTFINKDYVVFPNSTEQYPTEHDVKNVSQNDELLLDFLYNHQP